MHSLIRTSRLLQALCLCAGLLTLPATVLAQQPKNDQHHHPDNEQRPRPPIQSREACQGKAVNEGCTFDGEDAPVTGTCWQPNASTPLSCRPANGRHRQDGRQNYKFTNP